MTTMWIEVSPEAVEAAQVHVAAYESAGLATDPVVVDLANAEAHPEDWVKEQMRLEQAAVIEEMALESLDPRELVSFQNAQRDLEQFIRFQEMREEMLRRESEKDRASAATAHSRHSYTPLWRYLRVGRRLWRIAKSWLGGGYGRPEREPPAGSRR